MMGVCGAPEVLQALRRFSSSCYISDGDWLHQLLLTLLLECCPPEWRQGPGFVSGIFCSISWHDSSAARAGSKQCALSLNSVPPAPATYTDTKSGSQLSQALMLACTCSTGAVLKWCPKDNPMRGLLGTLKSKDTPVDLTVGGDDGRSCGCWGMQYNCSNGIPDGNKAAMLSKGAICLEPSIKWLIHRYMFCQWHCS